jgi:hypothetical protein
MTIRKTMPCGQSHGRDARREKVTLAAGIKVPLRSQTGLLSKKYLAIQITE